LFSDALAFPIKNEQNKVTNINSNLFTAYSPLIHH